VFDIGGNNSRNPWLISNRLSIQKAGAAPGNYLVQLQLSVVDVLFKYATGLHPDNVTAQPVSGIGAQHQMLQRNTPVERVSVPAFSRNSFFFLTMFSFSLFLNACVSI
jgi:homoserine kinase